MTPVLNAAATLPQTIHSVQQVAQRVDLEHWVIDGGSTDGSVQVLQEQELSDFHWISGSDHGLYDAINKGIRRCRGEWIHILNADDFYDSKSPGAIHRLLSNSSASILYGPVLYHMLAGRGLKLLNPLPEKRMRAAANVPMRHPGMLVHRSTYEKIGLYRKDFKVAADTDFMFRALDQKVALTNYPAPLVHVREGGISYQSYETSTLELHRLQKSRPFLNRIRSLIELYRHDRMKDSRLTPRPGWPYWSWAAEDFWSSQDLCAGQLPHSEQTSI